ncbi:unnamed protein product [Moneuplotes crassus]|uniref:Uncharacterized protein n=1 Tax=Euplotes crassus TaxID=5936 RepID=A0AAD2D7E1_EUPCR|nr:unnamed protein product [Moneuplotes crassus]
MLLSIISLHSPVIETSCSDTTSVDSFALSSLASISTVDLDSNFSHINYTSSLLNLLLISDDTSHLLKLIKSTEQLCECVSLPAAIDAASLETFLKVNKDKIILVHFSYFKWGAQMRKIFYQILYRNQRGLKNPVWMVVDVKDIGDKKNKGLKGVLGSQIYDMFDICLTYDEDITRCIGVSVKKHYYMNTLQNLKLNDLRHQTKVKNLEFPDIINQNKCVCPFDQVDDLFDDLAENPLSVQDLISQYYCKRSTFLRQNKNDKNEEQTSIKITPNRLSTIYKLAETVNFLRSLYIKNQSSSDENLDLIDGIIAIFFNELTALSDKTIRYSDKQLLRSYCVERVLSRMEARPFFELIDDEESEETPQRGQIFKNLNKKHIQASYEEPNIAVKEKDKICIGCQNLYYQSKEDGKIPLLLADFPTTYIGLIKAIFSG